MTSTWNNTNLPDEIYIKIFIRGRNLYRDETRLMETKGYYRLRYEKFVLDKIVEQFSNIRKEIIKHIFGNSGCRLKAELKRLYPNDNNAPVVIVAPVVVIAPAIAPVIAPVVAIAPVPAIPPVVAITPIETISDDDNTTVDFDNSDEDWGTAGMIYTTIPPRLRLRSAILVPEEQINEHDVICGHRYYDRPDNDTYAGNTNFHTLLQSIKQEYFNPNTTRIQKTRLVMTIVQDIREISNPQGRFLYLYQKSGEENKEGDPQFEVLNKFCSVELARQELKRLPFPTTNIL